MNPWITWGLVASLVFAREIYRWRRERKLARTLEMLEWRERFAKTRRDVVHLLACGELRPDSWVAASVYLVSSAMVRRASSYRSFARSLVIEALREVPKDEEITKRVRREIRDLSPDAREVFLRFLDDTHRLLTTYSWLYRAVAWLAASQPREAPQSQPPRRISWRPLDRRFKVYRTTEHLRRLAAA